jgi:hypothetical protein
MEKEIKPGFDTSKTNQETDGNYAEEILQERDFGSSPNGAIFGQSVMETNAPYECQANAPNFGLETSFGSDPEGERFGAPAPDKLGMIEQSQSWKSVTETLDERAFGSLTLAHDSEEGTRGPILPGRET